MLHIVAFRRSRVSMLQELLTHSSLCFEFVELTLKYIVAHNFSTFLRTFRRENPHFSECLFRSAAFSGEELLNHFCIFRFLKHFFLSVLCRLLPCFSPVIPIFHPESFAFCGCHLLFFISHSGILGFPKRFFLSLLCRCLPCFSPVIPIFI